MLYANSSSIHMPRFTVCRLDSSCFSHESESRMAASWVLAQALGPAPYLCVVHQNLAASEVQRPVSFVCVECSCPPRAGTSL